MTALGKFDLVRPALFMLPLLLLACGISVGVEHATTATAPIPDELAVSTSPPANPLREPSLTPVRLPTWTPIATRTAVTAASTMTSVAGGTSLSEPTNTATLNPRIIFRPEAPGEFTNDTTDYMRTPVHTFQPRGEQLIQFQMEGLIAARTVYSNGLIIDNPDDASEFPIIALMYEDSRWRLYVPGPRADSVRMVWWNAELASDTRFWIAVEEGNPTIRIGYPDGEDGIELSAPPFEAGDTLTILIMTSPSSSFQVVRLRRDGP